IDSMQSGRPRARDLMTAPVITAAETASAGELATLMLRHRIKRIPIMRKGRIVGIVSRADLISALACDSTSVATPQWRALVAGGGLPTRASRPLPIEGFPD